MNQPCNQQRRRRERVVGIAGLSGVLLLVAACGDRGSGGSDLPPFETRCTTCHDEAALTARNAGEGIETALWVGMVGAGLIRVDPLFPEPGTWWGTPWPERGRHETGSRCATCHPVQPDGSGHGLRVYPTSDLAFSGGSDCGEGCHRWLSESRQPGFLLKTGTNGHSNLWRNGARPQNQEAFRMSSFQPGCGGCHNGTMEDHGAIRSCLDCHDFQGASSAIHQAHEAAAPSCDSCHTGQNGPTERTRKVCWNCHPSGHRPR